MYKVKLFGHIVTDNNIVLFCDVSGVLLDKIHVPLIDHLSSIRGEFVSHPSQIYSNYDTDEEVRKYITDVLFLKPKKTISVPNDIVIHDAESTDEVLNVSADLQKLCKDSREYSNNADDSQTIHLVHSRVVDIELFSNIEKAANCDDLVFISTYIDIYHILHGPYIRSHGNPSFSDFYQNWLLFENNSQNIGKSWSYLMNHFDEANKLNLGTVKINNAVAGLVSYSLFHNISRYIDTVPPKYTWDEYFGVIYCNLIDGSIKRDNVIHGVM